jgi:hypothetical protein
VEVVSFEQAVGLHMAEHGLDGVPPSHLAADGRRGEAAGLGDHDLKSLARDAVAAAAAIDMGAPDRAAGEAGDLADPGREAVAVMEVSRQGLRAEHELAAGPAGVGDGDGHYARPEVMVWCETNGIDYIFGLPGNTVLRDDPVIAASADACAVFRAEREIPSHRTHCETRYGAKSWKCTRRVIARIEATTLGMDIRTIVTSLKGSTPERLYEFDYCGRGQAENMIKLHKTQLKSDRTSCMSAAANQFRLILHTAAYWLLWSIRQSIPNTSPLRRAEFTTLQNRLIKLGARIVETASRIRIAFASACPDKALIAALASALKPAPP